MTAVRQLWEGWKRIARVIGDFQARVILTLLYCILIMPLGLVVRLVSDPLHLRRKPTISSSDSAAHSPSYWIARSESTELLDEARRQF